MNSGIAHVHVTNAGRKIRVQLRQIEGDEIIDITVLLPMKDWSLREVQASALDRAAELAHKLAELTRR